MKTLYHLSQCWNCKKCELNASCLGQKITSSGKKILTGALKHRKPFKKGEKIFQLGNEFHSLYVIKSGAVLSRILTENGEECVKRFYFPGDILGIDSIGSEFYRNDAITLDTTMVCEIPYNRLEELCLNFPSLHQDLIKKFTEEIQSLESRFIYERGNRKGIEKVFSFLNLLIKKIGKTQTNGSIKIHLPMNKNSIANFLGIRPESFSRNLDKLSKQGYLANSAHDITILKPVEFTKSNLAENL